LFRLYAEGLIDGVRVDHIDGLAQPRNYCTKLRARLRALEHKRPGDCPAGPAYFIVEKILARDETFQPSWEADGTTGYDFMDEVSALQHDGSGERPLTALWERISGRFRDFDREEELARREILQRSFSAQLSHVVRSLYQIAQGDPATRDIARPGSHRDPRPLPGLSDLRQRRACLGVGSGVSVAGGRWSKNDMPSRRQLAG
jgi:(1->4)-alpha-D-glucan 1-alpha-D-glucosylmutase